jgi:hypothetical protein
MKPLLASLALAVLPRGAPSDFFAPTAIGDPIRGDERPRTAQVAIADLDRDGLPDVLACDALRNRIGWIRQSPAGTFTEATIAEIPAPAHVTAIDFDGDGDLDLLVASLGVLMPSKTRSPMLLTTTALSGSPPASSPRDCPSRGHPEPRSRRRRGDPISLSPVSAKTRCSAGSRTRAVVGSSCAASSFRDQRDCH